MKALITGASSGLGRDMARVLAKRGYDIIAVARRKERLEELEKELPGRVETIVCDVTRKEDCLALGDKMAECDIFINNAGFGVFGEFSETDIDEEMQMLDTNVRAVHMLTKLCVKKFCERGSGKILNVASVAAFFPGPRFSAYYATKAYVFRLTQSIAEEVGKSGVTVSVLCPGPVHTEFEKVARMSFGKGKGIISRSVILESKYAAEYAIKKMLKGKRIIIPGRLIRAAVVMRHFLSENMLAKIVYALQSKRFAGEE